MQLLGKDLNTQWIHRTPVFLAGNIFLKNPMFQPPPPPPLKVKWFALMLVLWFHCNTYPLNKAMKVMI